MRVITGSFRGKPLVTLEGNDVRPTSSQVKESLFSAIQFNITDSAVLDLFAGSGQLGIEALSRGAKHVTFCDTSAKAREVILKNINACGIECDKYSLLAGDALSFLKSTDKKFDICFLDPPYFGGLYDELLGNIGRVMNECGIVLCEHPKGLLDGKCFEGLVAKKTYRFSKTEVTKFLR